MANAKAKQTLPEQWQAQTAAGGIKNPIPPRVASASPPEKPWTLTEEFNKAAKKPLLAATTPDMKRQIAELRKQMEAAAKGAGQNSQKLGKRQAIVSQQGINQLRKRLNQPRNTWELTPLGSVTRGLNPNRDRQLIREIKRQQAVLNSSRDKAKIAFNRSSGISR